MYVSEAWLDFRRDFAQDRLGIALADDFLALQHSSVTWQYGQYASKKISLSSSRTWLRAVETLCRVAHGNTE